MTAREKISAARAALILDQPFFGALALRLAVKEDSHCKTAWTDGTALGYNPKFIEGLSHAEITAVLAHEVMHCACGHPWRREAREHRRFNEAADYAINPILVDANFRLPENVLLDNQFRGKSAEWIYDRLPAPPPFGPGNSGASVSGERMSDPLGEVRDAPMGTESGETEADWQQATQQAANAAKTRGELPASLDRFVQSSARSRVHWRSVLRRFIQDAARADYSWRQPNRRYLGTGFYLPDLRSEEMGPIAIAIDTSGSIDRVLLEQFEAEVRAVADEVQPSRVTVLYCDARVQRIDTFEREDWIAFHPVGGGGTDFRPVFRAVAELEEAPVCLVYLTDLFGGFPEQESVPTLWVTPTDTVTPPFGEMVQVN